MGHLPTLRIQCFGPPALWVDGSIPAPDVVWRKHVALLVYLALSPGRSRSRHHLLGLLWPEKEQERARHSLNEAVRRLRLGLGRERLITTPDAITLNDIGLSMDVLEGPGPPGTEFLEGFVLPDAPEFEHWLELERVRRVGRAVELLLGEGERALSRANLAAAADCALRVLRAQPSSEPAVRLRMRAQALSGDAAGALQTYQEFVRWLGDEIGEPPSAGLSGLAERIRSGRWRQETAAGPMTDPPLVGRAEAHAAAFQEVAAALGAGPRLLSVGGIVGSGKSRLLRECVHRWELDGGTSALARPVESDRGVPWRVLHQLVRGGLGSAPGIRAAPPGALRVLVGAVPMLAEHVPGLAAAEGDVAAALAGVLRAVAEEQPLCVAIDDVQWADDDTVSALGSALRELSGQPMLMILSELEGAAEASPTLGRLYADVGRHVQGALVRLEPLAQPDLEQLVATLAPWCEGDEQRLRLTRRVAYESAGNPLFVVTLLQGLTQVAVLREDALVWPPPSTTLDAPFPMDVPNLVRSVIVARVNQLDAVARQVLIVAALAGTELDEAAIASVAECEAVALEHALVELERQRLVQFDGERYRLGIPFLAQVVPTAFLTPSQAHRLRARYEAARASVKDDLG